MAIGDIMPSFSGMQTTYKEDFSGGLGRFTEDKHIWSRETVINDEEQYYPDQSVLAAGDKTVFINAQGNLVLRTMPTPSYLQNSARVVLNNYNIEAVINSTTIEVSGVNYWDQPNGQNVIGIGPRRDTQGYLEICGVPFNYSSIIDLPANRHRITLTTPMASTLNAINCNAKIYRSQQFISGMVTTQNTAANGNSGFSQKFGRFGARIKCARGFKHFPAFWLWPDYEELNVTYTNVQKQSEKDIWEILGHAPDISYQTLHQPGFDMRPNGVPFSGQYNGVDQWKTSHMQQFQLLGPRDFSTDFYWVYCDWFTDNTFAFYYETAPNSGIFVEVSNARGAPPYVDGIIDESMLIFNNAFGSNWSKDQAAIDTGWPGYTGSTSFPLDFEISDVCVEQFEGQQTGNTGGSGTGTTSNPTYTQEPVVGPFGTIDDVVINIPDDETDRQGTIHEIEAKIAYRPYNIPVDRIGIQWFHNFPSPFQCTFVDGSDKQWRVRIHLTTFNNSPLPQTLQGSVFCQVYLLP